MNKKLKNNLIKNNLFFIYFLKYIKIKFYFKKCLFPKIFN